VTSSSILALAGVSKDYHGLRPLRVKELIVHSGERVAIVGLDHVMAEVFVNLATGAALPDVGDIQVFGRSTSTIVNGDEWLTIVDRFGLVSDRVVLLNSLSVLQNLAVPFTLEIDPPSDEALVRAIALASEVGLPESDWAKPVAALPAPSSTRVRLGRALALDPAIVLLEHPTVGVARIHADTLGDTIKRISTKRRAAVLALTADRTFASAIADRVLTLDPATGRLTDRRRRWFSSERG